MKNTLTFLKASLRMLPHRMRQNLFMMSVFLIAGSWAPGLALASTPTVHVKNKLFLSADVRIRGRVVDAQGNSMPGVTIQVEGTTTGTTTNANGRFTLDVPANSTLTISSIGYETQQVTIGAENRVLNIHLTQIASTLNQLVVIGYGSQRQEAITGSVATIGGAKLNNENPSSNISDALQGRLAGVQISQTSTQPGATQQILIRGQRSLTASNAPLIVLNGIPFPGSLDDIDPVDVKSISILKDASATAIYGSRGANGVILITTNTGTIGQKPQISYNSYYGVQKLFAPFPMMNGPEFVKLRTAAGMFVNGSDEHDSVNTNWQKLFYRPSAPVMNQNIDVSGGTINNGHYHLGLGYYNDLSLVPTQQFKRYSVNASLEQGIGRFIRIGFTSNTDYNTSEGSQVGLYNILSMSPIASPKNPDGSLKQSINMAEDVSWNETRYIVDSLKNVWLNPIKTVGTYNSFFGVVDIPGVPGLSYRINVGVNYSTTDNDSYTGTGITSTNPTTVSVATIAHQETSSWTVENLLTYDKTFLGKNHINATAMYSAEKDTYVGSNVSAQGIPDDQLQFYNLGQALGTTTINPNYQTYTQSGLESWMGRLIYEYSNRYMLTAVLRADGSSILAPGHQWHTSPAISAGWNIANESFMKGIPAINELKLRVGYGQTANQAVAPYSTLGRLTPSPYNYGPSDDVVGYYVSSLPNPVLGWEWSTTWNYGLDFALLNNRLSGTIEYYVTKTKDLLQNVSLPNTTGVGSVTQNIGNTQNKGLEFTVNGTILNDDNGWTWTAGVNAYANRNKLTALTSGDTANVGNDWFVGHPLNVVYDYQKIGLWQAGDPNLPIEEPGGNPGMIRVKYTGTYANGLATRAIGPADQQIINLDPKFQGGFNTTVRYKGFDFTAVGLFQDGGILISTLYSAGGYLNLDDGRRNNVKINYWTPTDTTALYPKPGGIMSGDNPKYGSTLGYFNSSYLKIQTLTLGYDFTRMKWLRNSGANISRLRLYVTVQNPFVFFSPYYRQSGLDPQTNSYGDQNQAVTSYQHRILVVGTNTPETRNYLLGLNLTF